MSQKINDSEGMTIFKVTGSEKAETISRSSDEIRKARLPCPLLGSSVPPLTKPTTQNVSVRGGFRILKILNFKILN